MRWLIASDIHGSAHYCQQLLSAFDREHADRMILLGDLLYHGPRNDLPEGYNPKEVLSLLNQRKTKILAVRGNCDTEVDQMVLEFPIMADYAILPLGSRLLYLTHGHHWNIQEPLPMSQNDVLIYGHTHVPLCQEKDGFLFCNPGSVSIPKENSPHSYMILDENKLSWKSLDGTEYMAHSF